MSVLLSLHDEEFVSKSGDNIIDSQSYILSPIKKYFTGFKYSSIHIPINPVGLIQ